MNAQLSAEGAAIGLRFEQWLLYYLHVAIHQKDRWAGDLQPVLDQPKESVV